MNWGVEPEITDTPVKVVRVSSRGKQDNRSGQSQKASPTLSGAGVTWQLEVQRTLLEEARLEVIGGLAGCRVPPSQLIIHERHRMIGAPEAITTEKPDLPFGWLGKIYMAPTGLGFKTNDARTQKWACENGRKNWLNNLDAVLQCLHTGRATAPFPPPWCIMGAPVQGGQPC